MTRLGKYGIVLIFLMWMVVNVCSQENKPLQKMSAEEISTYREKYIREFKRIYMNTPPEDARLLRILVQSSGAKNGIEVGSANGYGAINMGIGFEINGGHLTTIDIDSRMVRQCRENVSNMGLSKTVTCIEGDALNELPKITGPVDFVFIDAVKSDYLKYFTLLEPKLETGALIVAHNAIYSAALMDDFFDTIQNNPDYEMVIIRTGTEQRDGMAIIYKRR